MSQQDWTPVVFNKKKPTGKGSKQTSQAIQQGAQVETAKKCWILKPFLLLLSLYLDGAGGNKQRGGPRNARKLDDETEEFARTFFLAHYSLFSLLSSLSSLSLLSLLFSSFSLSCFLFSSLTLCESATLFSVSYL